MKIPRRRLSAKDLMRRPGDLVFDIGRAKLINPGLGELVAAVKPHAGRPRAEMTVPVSPVEAPSDLLVYEAPGDATEKFYLPRYDLATVATDRGVQFLVRLSRAAQGVRLTVAVVPTMSAEVKAAAPDAAPLPHELSAELTYTPPGDHDVRITTQLTDRRDLDDSVELGVTLSTPAEQSAVYEALTDAQAGATLVVRRRITVAVPAPAPAAEPEQRVRIVRDHRTLQKPDVRDHRKVAVPVATRALRQNLLISTRGVVLSPSVRVPIARPVASPVLRLAPAPIAPLRPDLVLIPPFRLKPRPEPATPADPGPPPEPHYRVTTRDIEQSVGPTPFFFNKDLHPYIYGDLTGEGSGESFVLDQIEHAGRHHSYYYAGGHPGVVYFLPDAFKLARVPEVPRVPMLTVGFDSEGGSTEGATATVVFGASPVASSDRLLAALHRIAQRTGVDLATLEAEPLLADATGLTLRLSLPGGAGATTTIPDARIDMRAGLSAGFQLPLTRFQTMFDSIVAADPTLFRGEVEVKLAGSDRPAEKVPVLARLDDLAGEALLVEPFVVAEEPRHRVRITNVVESPVLLQRVDAVLALPGGDVTCTVEGVDTADPLAPGEVVEARLVPASDPGSDLGSDQPASVDVDVHVQLDADAIWDAICEDTTSFVQRTVTVNVPIQMFDPPTDGEPELLQVLVELQGVDGGPVEAVQLNRDALSAQAHVSTPIADLMQRRLDAGEYRYRVSAVRLDRVQEGEWKTRGNPILWIVTADLV